MVAEWRPKGFEFEAELEMRNDKWRGQNLETEDALHGGFLEIVGHEGVAALVMQRGGGINRGDCDRPLQQHRPGIEAGIHLHDGDPGLPGAGGYRPLNRGSTAPAWQQ